MTGTGAPKKRIELIDSLRGLSVLLMVIHHFFYDVCWLLGDWVTAAFGERWILFRNPVFNVLHYIFAGTFILLAGVSSRFSRSNLRRGAICFAIAMVMTFVTGLEVINAPIRFGVLHLLGVCMMVYGLAADENVPRWLRGLIFAALFAASVWLLNSLSTEEITKWLFPLGWTYPGFSSSDYFPLFPWFFVFLLGTWAGWYIRERKLPGWFYSWRGVPFFSWLGRHSLLVYILHQPVLYGITLAIAALAGQAR